MSRPRGWAGRDWMRVGSLLEHALAVFENWCSFWQMGKLLNRLLNGSPDYTVSREDGGYMLIGRTDRQAEFSQFVREIADRPNDEFVMFPTCDGSGYSQVFVCPFNDAVDAPDSTA